MKARSLFGLFIMCLIGLFFSSCSENQAKIAISISGAEDSTMVIVSHLSFNEMASIDTLYTKNGDASIEMMLSDASPQFVYLNVKGEKTLPLVVLKGDRIHVNISDDGSFTVEGSEESLKMIKVDSAIAEFNREFAIQYRKANSHSTEQKIEEAKLTLGAMYIAQRKSSIRYIYENPKSITVIPLLYQKTPTGLPVFSQHTDVMIMRRAYDSLQSVYSNSPYVVSLAEEIELREKNQEMETRLVQADLIDFPEIELFDINGMEKKLSSLKGQVIMLLFWNSIDAEQRLFSTELKSVYSKLHNKGLEIYQVGVGADKTEWALQVKEQKLPWINVCDPTVNSMLFYNVKAVPAMFIISRDGNIVAKDLFDLNKLEAEIRRLL